MAIIVRQKEDIPDISFYQGAPDFDKLSSKTDTLILRAGQNTWIDPQFINSKLQAKSRNIYWGAYWFYDDRASPGDQVNKLKEVLENDSPPLGIWVDWENTYKGPYSGLENVVLFMKEIEKLFPDTKLGIYTGYYWFTENSSSVTNADEYTYLENKPLWLAWYTSHPEQIKIPAPWNKITLWQYGTPPLGEEYGVDSEEIDMNVFNGSLAEFNKFVGQTTTDDVSTEYFFQGKVEITHGHKDEPRPFYFHIAKFKRLDVGRVHVNGGGFLGTVEYFWKTRGQPDIVINGDEGWYERSPIVPKGLGVSDGNIYRSTSDETNVQWDKTHQILGMSAKPLNGVFNACGGSNILLQDGIIPTNLDNVHVDPRTSIFWNDDYYFIIMIDGRNNGTQGLTRKELSEFALSLGATNGHNNDGGDSCALLINDNEVPVIKNNPPNNKLHSLVNHIGFWINHEQEGDAMNYRILKTVRKRPQPSMYSASSVDALAGFEFFSEITRSVTEDIDGKSQTVEWIQLPDNYWVPVEYKGSVYVESLDIVPPPPPTDGWPEYFILETPEGERTKFSKEQP